VIELIARNRRAVIGTGRAVYMFPVFFTVLGVMFAAAGLALPRAGLFVLPFGAAFIALGLVYGFRVRRIHRRPD
jgi:hypothetical protein